MSDAAPRMYAWDVRDGACGASRDKEQALAVVAGELTGAAIGTVAEIVEVYVSGYGTTYEPVRSVARAVRTDKGIVWTETAAAEVPGGSPAAARGM